MRALLALALIALAGPARAACLLACDEVTTGAEAAERLRELLGPALPKGAEVEGLVEGGFQDRFVQARLRLDAARLKGLLAALGAMDLRPAKDVDLGPPAPDWWDWAARAGGQVAEGSLPGLPFATLLVVPGEAPGRWTAYLWAFQT